MHEFKEFRGIIVSGITKDSSQHFNDSYRDIVVTMGLIYIQISIQIILITTLSEKVTELIPEFVKYS